MYKDRFYDSKQYVIGAQLIYVDIDLENLQYDIVYSEPANLLAKFEEELVLFEDECIDTCSISGFDKDSYKLIVVIENTTLRIDEIKYTVEKKVKNITKPKEKFICKDFQDSVLWSSSYSLLPEGSTKYQTWRIGTNCSEAGGHNCFLQNINITARSIYMGYSDLDGNYDPNVSGEGYVQISDPDELVCDNPESGIYSRYIAFETVKGEGKKIGQYCGKNKNPNARCAFDIAKKYDDNVNCYGIKAHASQYFLVDVFKVKYTWCWDNSNDSKGGKG